jgi:paraquat-inducible protein B
MADRQAAIGAFVLGGIVIGLGAIVFFGSFRIFQPTSSAAVVFEGSISGLSVGAPVTFRGVRVGAVERIQIIYQPTNKTAYIPVTLRLEPDRVRVAGARGRDADVDLPTMISRGLRAELVTQSFVTGQSQIDLDFDAESPAVLHPDVTPFTEIPTRQSAIQRVTQQLSELPIGELVGNANAALISIRNLSEKLDTDLPPLVDSLKATSDGASHTLDVATHTLDTATTAMTDLQGKLDATLANLNTLVTNTDQQLAQRSADLHALIASTSQSVQQTHQLLADLQSVTSSRGETRTNLDATLRDLAAAAASLRGFASDVEHNPQLLLTGRRP